MKKEISKNKNCVSGIKKNHRGIGSREINLIVGDTETVHGNSHTLQMYDGKEIYFEYVDNDTILDKFIDYIEKHTSYYKNNIIYFHNLEFDMMILFYKYRLEIYKQGNRVLITYKDWDIILYTSKVFFIVMRNHL